MANVSQQFMDDMGPLSALWAGRDQGLQENTSLVNQQVGLESIANSQQTRDIQKQKLPFELSQLEHQQKMNPLLLEQQGTKNKSDLAKIDKDQFDSFFNDFKMQIPTLTGTPADAAVLGEVAKKNGMDPADPRIARMIQTGASGNQQAITDMITKIAQMNDKHIQDMTKERFTQGQQTGRTLLEQEGADRRANIAAETQRAAIAQRAAAVDAKANTIKLTIDQQIAGLEREMDAAKTQEEKRAFANRIKYLVNVKREIATAVQERRTEDAAQLIERLQSGVGYNPPASNLTTPPNSAGGSPAPTAVDPNKRYTAAEAQNLPKGTRFTGTDGKTYEVK